MLDLFLKLFGDPNSNKVRKMYPIVDHINSLEEEFSKLTDEQLKNKTNEFREILAKRPTSPDLKKLYLKEKLQQILKKIENLKSKH